MKQVVSGKSVAYCSWIDPNPDENSYDFKADEDDSVLVCTYVDHSDNKTQGITTSVNQSLYFSIQATQGSAVVNLTLVNCSRPSSVIENGQCPYTY